MGSGCLVERGEPVGPERLPDLDVCGVGQFGVRDRVRVRPAAAPVMEISAVPERLAPLKLLLLQRGGLVAVIHREAPTR